MFFPTGCGCTLGTLDKLQEILYNISTFLVGENYRDPKATGTKVFRLESDFLSSFSSIIKAYPDARKLASVNSICCFPTTGCLSASPQASARLALMVLKSLTNSSDMIFFASAFKNSYIPINVSDSREI